MDSNCIYLMCLLWGLKAVNSLAKGLTCSKWYSKWNTMVVNVYWCTVHCPCRDCQLFALLFLVSLWHEMLFSVSRHRFQRTGFGNCRKTALWDLRYAFWGQNGNHEAMIEEKWMFSLFLLLIVCLAACCCLLLLSLLPLPKRGSQQAPWPPENPSTF